MTPSTYHRWPRLSDYSDSHEIETHWPRRMGKTWSLPPVLNVLLEFTATSVVPAGVYKGSTQLQRSYGVTWAYEPLRWPGNEGIRMVSKFSMEDPHPSDFSFFWCELHFMMQDIYRVGWSRDSHDLIYDQQPDYAQSLNQEIYTTHTYPTDGTAFLYPVSPDKGWAIEFTPQ